MPIKTFWMMHRNIDRITAGSDLRKLSVLIHSQSSEGAEAFAQSMREQMGRIAEVDEAQAAMTVELDSAGLAELKDMGRI